MASVFTVNEYHRALCCTRANKKYIIGFKQLKDAQKVLFQVDARTIVYMRNVRRDDTASLVIEKRKDIQFGKVFIKEMNVSKQKVPMIIAEVLSINNDSKMEFDCKILN